MPLEFLLRNLFCLRQLRIIIRMISTSPEIVMSTVHRYAATATCSEIMKGRAFYYVPAVITPYSISYDSYFHRYNLSPARLTVSC